MSNTTAVIRTFIESDRADLLAELGDWFGIPEANTAYIKSLGSIPSAVALQEQESLHQISNLSELSSALDQGLALYTRLKNAFLKNQAEQDNG